MSAGFGPEAYGRQVAAVMRLTERTWNHQYDFPGYPTVAIYELPFFVPRYTARFAAANFCTNSLMQEFQ